jgi:hypothetical protein
METPEDRLSPVDGSAASPAERDPSEPPPPVSREDHVIHVAAPLRVLALVMTAGLVGVAGRMVMMVWTMFTEGWAGRAPMDQTALYVILIGIFFFSP